MCSGRDWEDYCCCMQKQLLLLHAITAAAAAAGKKIGTFLLVRCYSQNMMPE